MATSMNHGRLALVALVGTACLTSGATAHDFVTTYESRAECEQAYVEMNKFDRDWLLANFPQLFGSRGDVMHFLTQHINCEYDAEEDVWFMADHRFD